MSKLFWWDRRRVDIPIPKRATGKKKAVTDPKQLQISKSHLGEVPSPVALVCPTHKAFLDSISCTSFMGLDLYAHRCLVLQPYSSYTGLGQGVDPTLKAPLGIAQMKLSACSGPAAKELLCQSHMLTGIYWRNTVSEFWEQNLWCKVVKSPRSGYLHDLILLTAFFWVADSQLPTVFSERKG